MKTVLIWLGVIVTVIGIFLVADSGQIPLADAQAQQRRVADEFLLETYDGKKSDYDWRQETRDIVAAQRFRAGAVLFAGAMLLILAAIIPRPLFPGRLSEVEEPLK